MLEKFNVLKKNLLEGYFSNLNNRQLDVVFNIDGPMVVLAGAGSGKTTAIISRIVNMVHYGNSYFEKNFDIQNINEDVISKLKEASINNNLDDVKDLIKINAVNPHNILSITFTNKAAKELRSRLEEKLGSVSKDICASTFHSLCASILRTHATKLGYSNNFAIYDDDDSVKLVKECLKLLNLDDKMVSPRIFKNNISKSKDKLIDYRSYKMNLMDNPDPKLLTIADVYETYQKKLLAADAMDFDDLIFNTVKLFKEFPEVLKVYQDRFKYILVDEYQDTNYAQYILIKSLAKKSGNLCVVGDDDQSIYKFRGASIENIIDFEKNFPGAKLIKFEQNYRSTKNIIDSANSVICNNINRKGKNLWTENDTGNLIKLHTAFSEHDEANCISDIIQERVSNGEKYSDSAVLYRKNSQSNVIERVFVRKGIPYRVFGGLKFYDRKEIKDMLAYLSVINNPMDEIRLKRIINQPRRSIGERTISQATEISKSTNTDLLTVMRKSEKYESLKRVSIKLKSFSNLIDEFLFAYNVEKLSISKLYELVLKKTEYVNYLKSDRDGSESKIENVYELLNTIKFYEETKGENATLSGFLEEVSLFSDIDNYDNDSDYVILMTIHSAKGLEFPNVFLPGMEEGIFPSMQCIFDESEIEEERRLAYVGITRCKNNLYIFNSDSRMISGTTSHNKASRFLSEIPENLIIKTKSRDWKKLKDGETIPKSVQEQRNDSILAAHNFGGISAGKSDFNVNKFNSGDVVNHSVFGEGIINSSSKMGNDFMLDINFNNVGSKRLMANFANLKKM